SITVFLVYELFLYHARTQSQATCICALYPVFLNIALNYVVNADTDAAAQHVLKQRNKIFEVKKEG
ncbi:hypothetical protein AIZ12_25650, partial [Salmonella enterica subsp. enterica serovar Typhimurium]